MTPLEACPFCGEGTMSAGAKACDLCLPSKAVKPKKKPAKKPRKA